MFEAGDKKIKFSKNKDVTPVEEKTVDQKTKNEKTENSESDQPLKKVESVECLKVLSSQEKSEVNDVKRIATESANVEATRLFIDEKAAGASTVKIDEKVTESVFDLPFGLEMLAPAEVFLARQGAA